MSSEGILSVLDKKRNAKNSIYTIKRLILANNFLSSFFNGEKRITKFVIREYMRGIMFIVHLKLGFI